MVLLFVKPPRKSGETKAIVPLLKSMDPVGSALLMPLLIPLLLALQWGGTTYAWSNWRIILCLCLFGVLTLGWLYVQFRLGDEPTLPLRLIRQRSVASGMIYMLGINGAVFIIVYYVAIWFQAVKDLTAERSGINFLTSSTSVSVASILLGVLVGRKPILVAPDTISNPVLLTCIKDRILGSPDVLQRRRLVYRFRPHLQIRHEYDYSVLVSPEPPLSITRFLP